MTWNDIQARLPLTRLTTRLRMTLDIPIYK